MPQASQEQSGSELMTLLMMLAHQAGGDSARSTHGESHLLQNINESYSLDAAILLAVKEVPDNFFIDGSFLPTQIISMFCCNTLSEAARLSICFFVACSVAFNHFLV